MATVDPERETDAPVSAGTGIDVTEIWPGRFALEIETEGTGVSTTTTHDLDAEQLRALSDRIDAALAEAH